jgi:hypothetical protein
MITHVQQTTVPILFYYAGIALPITDNHCGIHATLLGLLLLKPYLPCHAAVIILACDELRTRRQVPPPGRIVLYNAL